MSQRNKYIIGLIALLFLWYMYKNRYTDEGFEDISNGAMWVDTGDMNSPSGNPDEIAGTNGMSGVSNNTGRGVSTNVQPICSQLYNTEGVEESADISRVFKPTQADYNCGYKRQNEAMMEPELFVNMTQNTPTPLLKGATYVDATASSSVCDIRARYARDPLLYSPIGFTQAVQTIDLNNEVMPIVKPTIIS